MGNNIALSLATKGTLYAASPTKGMITILSVTEIPPLIETGGSDYSLFDYTQTEKKKRYQVNFLFDGNLKTIEFEHRSLKHFRLSDIKIEIINDFPIIKIHNIEINIIDKIPLVEFKMINNE